MAHVEDRWHKTVTLPDGSKKKERTARYGTGRRWKVRYEVDGHERSKSFERRTDAVAECARVEAQQAAGTFIDPSKGKITLRSYGQQWLIDQRFGPSTRERVEGELRRHILPQLGDRALGSIKPSTVRGWRTQLKADGLGDSSVLLNYGTLSSMLVTAVEDGLIPSNPCSAASARPPRPARRKVVPWPAERVEAVRAAMAERYRATVDAAAGCGLRQGEVLGLGVDLVDGDDVEWLRGIVHVRRQVRLVRGQLVFAPPKHNGIRDVPLPSSVGQRWSAHMQAYPLVPVTLPWEAPGGKPVTVRLMFTSPTSTGVIHRSRYNYHVWRPALLAAGVPAARSNGMHALRHWYASTLLEDGVSIRALAEYLGHADPSFTLRTYAHLMPSSEGKAKTAIDRAFTPGTADVPETSQRAG
jgi:integrase